MSGFAVAISADDHPLAVVEADPQMVNMAETKVVKLTLRRTEREGLFNRLCTDEQGSDDPVVQWTRGYLQKPYTKRNCQLTNRLISVLWSRGCSYSATVKAAEGTSDRIGWNEGLEFGFQFQTRSSALACPKTSFATTLYQTLKAWFPWRASWRKPSKSPMRGGGACPSA